MQLTGERKDSDVQYEVVTHDIRVVCQHAGCDSASALSKVEEMKERVVKKYEYMEIVYVDV
jgi:hypothetical protein